jgi:ABC-type lipoprotein release transport system permease subunit
MPSATPLRPIRRRASKLGMKARQWRRAIKQLNAIPNFASCFVGTIMAIGATVGAVHSSYAIVDLRHRELATLRAIGFGAGAIVVSILCESIPLALPGALLGGFLAWAFSMECRRVPSATVFNSL